MKLGVVGLGIMGCSVTERSVAAGHEVVGFDLLENSRRAAAAAGASTVTSLAELVQQLERPRAVWLMLPAGPAIDEVLAGLAGLDSGDMVVDGGNSDYHDSVRRAAGLRERGINFLDIGMSGGRWGRGEGFCLMIGGERAVVQHLDPIFQALAGDGYAYIGDSGAGHYAKLVLVGILHALIESYAEGFDLLRANPLVRGDFGRITEVWSRTGLIQSLVLQRVAQAHQQGVFEALRQVPPDALHQRMLDSVGQVAGECATEAFERDVAGHILAASSLAHTSHAGEAQLSEASLFYTAYRLQNGTLRSDEPLGQFPQLTRAVYPERNPQTGKER
jgi:6-phosphogluconate dehydrogenase